MTEPFILDVATHDMAHGGEAVARLEGKTWFVAGAMPGERVRGEVVVDKGAWGRLHLRSIEQASPRRVEPPCAHFGTCGGCQWQFADHRAQAEWKRSTIAGQLRHLGGIADPVVHPTIVPSAPYGYRNRMDFAVLAGRPALFRGRSRDLVAIDHCWLLEPALADLVNRLGALDGIERITLRTSVATGETLAVVTGDMPEHVAEWGSAVVRRRGSRYQPMLGHPWVTETVAGHGFRISSDAFFQNSTGGAETLVRLVVEAAEPADGDVVLDGYAGGGLFATALASSADRVVAVESHPVAVTDLRFNTKEAGDVRVVAGRVEELDGDAGWTVAVVDPPRTGLGPAAVDSITRPSPRAVVYVSCDPASLARDARLLGAAGYVHESTTPVDMFPQTFHIESVSRFRRVTGA